jgi:hypothetical protein
MKRHRSWPSPALVVASVALIVALGGTSYAALKLPKNSVGAKQIKSNAVTSAKIKNGTLKTTDFKANDAPEGPQGPQGPAGPSGASQGYAGKASDILVDVYDKVIVTKNLPAGKYILSATVDAKGFGNPTTGYMGGIGIIDCTIPGYHTASYYLKADDTYVSEQKSLSLHSGIDHPGGPVQLICSRTWNSVYVDEAALTAVKVDSLG